MVVPSHRLRCVSLPNYIFPAASVLSTELETETILIEMGSERYFSLKGTGSSFWRLIQADPSIERVIEALLREYAVDEAVLRRDLTTLCGKLAEQGLATPSATAP